VKGIGKSIANKIDKFLQTGEMKPWLFSIWVSSWDVRVNIHRRLGHPSSF
jgi:DNA polymerase/3'-5' exonuclease PolX